MAESGKFQYQAARFTLGGSGPRAPAAPPTSSSPAIPSFFSKAASSRLDAFRKLTSSLASKLATEDDTLKPSTPVPESGVQVQSEPHAPQGLEDIATEETRTDAADDLKDATSSKPEIQSEQDAAPEEHADDVPEPRPDFIAVPSLAAAKPQNQVKAPETTLDIDAAGENPYWMRSCQNINSPMLRLHQEIVSLVELLHPTPAEAEARQAAVSQVEEVVKSIWPQAEVQVFGSFATGLYVPTSDVDIVVLNSDAGQNLTQSLHALRNSLVRKGVAKTESAQAITRARVPIVKFETVDHGSLAFDVSFDVANGPQAAELVKEYVTKWPMMRYLILILKLFLQQRELNEVYTGGIGSYALITMVAAFMQLHSSRRPERTGAKARLLEPSLGVLLVDFFRFYGRVINTTEVGVSCAKGGHFYLKRNKGGQDWSNGERPYMMSVEDPKDDTNDICRSSFNIMKVKSAFDFAYQVLTAPGSRPSESLLARILRLGPMLASRSRPTNPRAFYSKPQAPAAIAAAAAAAAGASQTRQRQECGEGRDMQDTVDLVSEDDGDDDDDDGSSGSDGGHVGGKRRSRQGGQGGGGKRSRHDHEGKERSGGGSGRHELHKRHKSSESGAHHHHHRHHHQKGPHHHGNSGGSHMRFR